MEVLTGSFQDNVLQKLNKTSESSTGEDAFLRLEVLELEQITLSVPILMSIIDWMKMTTLSLVECKRLGELWRNLRRRYAPSSETSTRRDSGVSMDMLYQIILCRHQSSLKRIRINVRENRDGVIYPLVFKRRMLSFITSGNMPQLRELSMSISEHDWVGFLVISLIVTNHN